MTTWGQKRLAVGLGVSLLGGALVWNSGALQAQSYSDAEVMKLARSRGKERKLTRIEATTIFADFMNSISQESGNPYVNTIRMLISVSPKSERQLGNRQSVLLSKMVTQWKQNKQKFKVQSQGSKTKIASGETNRKSINRPLILCEDSGGWGVDLVETYSNWNHLQGVPKLQAIYQLTGVALEGLPHTAELERSACQTNLKRLALGIAQYARDYDGKLPPAKSWSDSLQPYVKHEKLFTCPVLPSPSLYGYSYNSKLSGISETAVTKREQTVSIYETSVLKRNAHGTGENLAFRHLNGSNYAFADGHVKWFAKGQIPSFDLKPFKNQR